MTVSLTVSMGEVTPILGSGIEPYAFYREKSLWQDLF